MTAKELKQRIEDAIFDGIEPEEGQTEHEAAELLIREYTEKILIEYHKISCGIRNCQCKYYGETLLTELFKEEDKG